MWKNNFLHLLKTETTSTVAFLGQKNCCGTKRPVAGFETQKVSIRKSRTNCMDVHLNM
jgi:hypothetical protein